MLKKKNVRSFATKAQNNPRETYSVGNESNEGWEVARADHFLLVQGHCLQDFMLHPFKVWMQFSEDSPQADRGSRVS